MDILQWADILPNKKYNVNKITMTIKNHNDNVDPKLKL